MDSLFVYGTLMPGCENAHLLESIGGNWVQGSVYGSLLDQGWGAGMGYPGIVLDNTGNRVDGYLFCSERLSEHWDALDEFEGEEYARVPVEVTTKDGEIVISFIYMVVPEAH
ncbi:MAG: gamma-glutamylcyclotransferase [Symbiopectobacterium sp.]|uniref:gamma-glutamylcyclotransferase family protein n=1 Tax=Symbiopectobacterium sp. TaxID=2952789 RepID=UPI0039EABE91